MTRSIHTERYDLLCELLREARKKAELRQWDVADALDRPQSFVAKYERGERRLDVIEFIEVCEVLGIVPETLVKALSK